MAADTILDFVKKPIFVGFRRLPITLWTIPQSLTFIASLVQKLLQFENFSLKLENSYSWGKLPGVLGHGVHKTRVLSVNFRKGTSLRQNTSFEPTTMMIGVWAVRVMRKKQHKKQWEEKSQKGDKSKYCRDAPAGRILNKFGMGADPDDIVTCAKFDVNPLKRFGFWRGQICCFP